MNGQSINLQAIATALATLAIVTPLFVSYPFLPSRSYVPELGQVETICSRLPNNAIVVWIGGARNILVEPTQTFCGVPSFGLISTSDQDMPAVLQKLARVASSLHKAVIIGEDGNSIPQYNDQLTSISTITYSDIKMTYKIFPRDMVSYTKTIKLAEIAPNGKVVSL